MKTKLALDPRLKSTLQSFAASWAAKRAACFEGMDFEALRDRLARRKDDVIVRQNELLALFEKQARRHGSEVLRAVDGEEANRMILEILDRHGAKKIVKSKSMVSEEIRLNAFLSRQGIESLETDLGEWIVQQADAPPTHMVMPAIHLSREGVAEILSRRLGRGIEEDIPGLVQIGREEIRREIFKAEAGLTGANGLIAENGTVMLVTNEGNGRLVSTVPPLHIVLASTEKILESTEDALLLLRILTRNATGQPISSYVSFIAGPQKRDQFIILLDNHRRELREDADFRDVLRCIKCSACLNVCPVYQIVGGGVFSHVYMGGIGSLLTAWIHGLGESRQLAELCTGCHRCEEVCAAKIPIADLVVRLKKRLRGTLGAKIWKRAALDGIMGYPGALGAVFGLGRAARPVIEKKGYARALPLRMKKYDRFRALPAPAPKPLSRLFRVNFTRSIPHARRAKGQLILFPGCLIQHIYPDVGTAAVRVLSRLGYEVVLGPTTCCGFPAWNSGHHASAGRSFRYVYQRLERGEGPVITLCPTCTTMLATAGPEMLRENIRRDPEVPEARFPSETEIERFSRRIIPFSRFLARSEMDTLRRLRSDSPPKEAVTYHDSCHHRFVLKASEDSRDLIRLAISGEIAEMKDSSSCCGFAGAFSIDHPEVGEALLGDKLDSVRSSGASIIALDCPGCLLQIRGGLARRGTKTRVMHTAELLDVATRGGRRTPRGA